MGMKTGGDVSETCESCSMVIYEGNRPCECDCGKFYPEINL